VEFHRARSCVIPLVVMKTDGGVPAPEDKKE